MDSSNKNKVGVTKTMKYSVATKFVNFDPNMFASKIVIVDGQPALLIKGRIFKKING